MNTRFFSSHLLTLSKLSLILCGALLFTMMVPSANAMQPTQTLAPPTNTPNPTPAKTVQQAATSALTAWTFYDPANPGNPPLISKARNAYQLAPDWQVSQVEYVFKWWGLSPNPVFDDQILEVNGTGYQIGNKTIDPALVKRLIASISNLQPFSSIISGRSVTDTYPMWQVELTGKDGQHIILISLSTSNPGAAPWNIIYNGRIYGQTDGTLGSAISNLFPSVSGEPLGHLIGAQASGTVIFGTSGPPAQIAYGFVDLLPIADGFDYHIDRAALRVEGTIEGRSAIGTMVIGTITSLASVELSLSASSTVSCTTATVSSTDPRSAVWTFTCPLKAAPLNSLYDYPIKVTFGTNAGQKITSEGRLQGKIVDQNAVLYNPPLEIQQVLIGGSAAAADLLTDHVLIQANYDVQADASTSKPTLVSGEAVLLGQTKLGNQTVRYTVGTPFAIEDGQVRYWTLTRAALAKMIQQIGNLALTQRIYAKVPNVTLNLWYAEQGDFPTVDGLLDQNGRLYEASLVMCGTVPRVSLPKDEPLRGFGFGSTWSSDFGFIDFLLVNDQPVVNELTLWPASNQREGALPMLIPRQIDRGNATTFERIALFRFFGEPDLMLEVADSTDATTKAALRQLAETLPGTADFKYDPAWDIHGVTLQVASDGFIDVVPCRG